MMQLKGAPFDPKDKTLVTDAGACALCPKRTGNEKELFADVGCFRLKCDAARTRLLATAKDEGKAILSPEESLSFRAENPFHYFCHERTQGQR